MRSDLAYIDVCSDLVFGDVCSILLPTMQSDSDIFGTLSLLIVVADGRVLVPQPPSSLDLVEEERDFDYLPQLRELM